MSATAPPSHSSRSFPAVPPAAQLAAPPAPRRADFDTPGDSLPRPHTNTYWLLPGRLLAGEHPGYAGAVVLPLRLQALQAVGAACFIDLTGAADPVPAYQPLAVGTRAARRLNFPVADFGLPSEAGMRGVLQAIEAALVAGEVVYLHCRAGIGRTGTVAGCVLVEHGFSGDEALALLQRKWHAMAKRAKEPHTPETEAQRDFIRRWQPAPAARAPEA